MPLSHLGEGGEPLDRPDAQTGPLRRGGERGALSADLSEALVADEHGGVRVAQDVGHLGRHQVVVDRHQVPAGLEGGQVELEHLDAVGQHGGDDAARFESESPHTMDHLVASARGVDRGQPLRLQA